MWAHVPVIITIHQSNFHPPLTIIHGEVEIDDTEHHNQFCMNTEYRKDVVLEGISQLLDWEEDLHKMLKEDQDETSS